MNESLEKKSDISVEYPFFDCSLPVDMRVMFRSRFFYPNACFLCGDVGVPNPSNLRRCSSCKMISYCCKEHQVDHWPDHRAVCAEINHLLKSSSSNNLFDFLRTMKDPEKRLKKKQSLMAIIQKRLNRNLNACEIQMFLHPRVCVVCLESNPDLLHNCSFCTQVSFCENHVNDPEHSQWCLYYRICFLLDWKSIFDSRFEISPSIKKVPFIFHSEDAKLPENMDKFMAEYIEETIPMLISLNGAKLWPHVCSELYTDSLTLMNVFKDLNLEIESELIIHIIGIQQSITKDFANFEMLLHLIPQLLSLKVVIVGKKIGQIEKEIKCEVEVCNVCSAGNKTLFIEMIKLPYVSYVERKSFKAPHIVIAYNFEENDVHLWSESVKKMMKIRAPLVMTTSTKQRAQTEHEKMTDLFGYLTSKSFFKKNPFAGDRPYRDAQEDGLKFSNNYVAVYSLYEEQRDKKPKKKRRNREPEIEWPDFVLEEEREQRRQKILARQKEAAQAASQSTDDSEDNPDKKSSGQKKSKKKKKNTAKQTSDSGRENNSPEKEEKSKNVKKEDDSEALNSSNEVEESEELLDDQTFNPPDQDEESIPSPEEKMKDKDDLMDRGEPRTKVPSLKKETKDESGKSNSGKQRSDSTHQKEESATSSGHKLAKFGESSTGKKNSSKQNEGTKNEESMDAQTSGTFKLPAVVEQDKSEMEGSSKSKKKKNKKKSKNQESTESSNKKELVEQQNESNSSKQNEMLEKNKKPTGQSVDSDQSEDKVQEQKEGSKKSRKRRNKKLKSQESAQLNIEKGEPAENQDEPVEQKEESSDNESAQGLALIAKKTANLQDENIILQRKITLLAAHYSDLKQNGEKMGHDLLRQIAMMKESLEILEHRVRNALESNEEV